MIVQRFIQSLYKANYYYKPNINQVTLVFFEQCDIFLLTLAINCCCKREEIMPSCSQLNVACYIEPLLSFRPVDGIGGVT